MEIQNTLTFLTSFYFGYLFFSFGHQLKISLYVKLNLIFFLILSSCLVVDKNYFFMTRFINLFPLTIGVVGIFISFLIKQKKETQALAKVLVFYDLLGVNLRFGKSFSVALESSAQVLMPKNKKNANVCKNVVMQQLKSSSYAYFLNLHDEIEKLSKVKIGVMDLIEFNYESLRYENLFRQKKSAALSQFYVQSVVVGSMWLICITYLLLKESFFNYQKLILVSFLLMLLGFYISYRLLCKSEFRI